MRVTDPHKAVDYIIANSSNFAKAKAERIYLEEFRKSKKAVLMGQSALEAANAREQYAYSHPEYLELLDGLRAAIEIEEKLKWELIGAQARIEIWRSQEATNRAVDKVMK